MRCEICHEREATIHDTKVEGDVITSSNICPECFEATEPKRSQELFSIFQAGCHYCGGEPDCTAPDLSADLRGEQRLWALCKRCRREFYRFCNQKLPGFGQAKMAPEQIAQVPALLAELDEHMKKWVSERGNDDAP